MLSFFPRGVLDEILNLIESVSEDFPPYFGRIEMVNIQCVGITELKCGKHTMYRYYGIEMW